MKFRFWKQFTKFLSKIVFQNLNLPYLKSFIILIKQN